VEATTAADAATNVDFEISNLAEIYREISRAVEQVRRRTSTTHAASSGTTQHDRPVTRATANKTPNAATVRSPQQSSTPMTAGKDSVKRQTDMVVRKVQVQFT